MSPEYAARGWIPVSLPVDPSLDAATPIFIAQRNFRLRGVLGRTVVVNGSALVGIVRKAASGTSLASGTTIASGSIDYNASVGVNQRLAVIESVAQINAGEAVGLVLSVANTAAVGIATILLSPADPCSIVQRPTGELGIRDGSSGRPEGWIPVPALIYPQIDADTPVFIARRPYRVKGIVGRPSAVNGAALTATVRKAASGTAISAGTALHSGSVDLNTGASVHQEMTLSTTPGVLNIATGDAIGIDYSDVNTAAFGSITILLAPR